MSSQGLLYKFQPNTEISAQKAQPFCSFTPNFTFHAEKHSGACVTNRADKNNSPTFICQYLHVFELSSSDVQHNKWCPHCSKRPSNSRKSSFLVSYDNARDAVDVNCASGHGHKLNISELRQFKACPACSSAKTQKAPKSEEADCVVDSVMKSQEAMFIEAYKRLVEAFPLIRKLPTNGVVSLYFENEIFGLPVDVQPNCLAVYLILEHKSFVRSIFERLNEALRKKFVHKIATGIAPAAKFDAQTARAFEFIRTFTH